MRTKAFESEEVKFTVHTEGLGICVWGAEHTIGHQRLYLPHSTSKCEPGMTPSQPLIVVKSGLS